MGTLYGNNAIESNMKKSIIIIFRACRKWYEFDTFRIHDASTHLIREEEKKTADAW